MLHPWIRGLEASSLGNCSVEEIRRKFTVFGFYMHGRGSRCIEGCLQQERDQSRYIIRENRGKCGEEKRSANYKWYSLKD